MLAKDGPVFDYIHALLESFNPHWPACERWVESALPALSLIVSATVRWSIRKPSSSAVGCRGLWPSG